MKLRVHHLLCVPLFTGHGYSEAFTEHMTEKVCQLKQGCEVHLTTGPDEICSACPNLSADGHSCMLDTDHVKTKDEQLLSLLGLQTAKAYDSSKLWKMVKERMKREDFEASCKNCEWYKMGLCGYEAYSRNIQQLIKNMRNETYSAENAK